MLIIFFSFETEQMIQQATTRKLNSWTLLKSYYFLTSLFSKP